MVPGDRTILLNGILATCLSFPWGRTIGASWRLRDGRVTILWNDLLIGTLAIETDCQADAVGKHFEMFGAILGLRLYQPRYGGSFQPEAKVPS